MSIFDNPVGGAVWPLINGPVMKYIAARIRPVRTFYGYDPDRNLITSECEAKEFVEKVIKIDRILSFTDEYIFLECPHGTVQTWEYDGDLRDIKAKLIGGGLLLD